MCQFLLLLLTYYNYLNEPSTAFAVFSDSQTLDECFPSNYFSSVWSHHICGDIIVQHWWSQYHSTGWLMMRDDGEDGKIQWKTRERWQLKHNQALLQLLKLVIHSLTLTEVMKQTGTSNWTLFLVLFKLCLKSSLYFTSYDHFLCSISCAQARFLSGRWCLTTWARA